MKPMNSNAGMSLIEITIAVAILAVMLTSLLALMPQGLTAARDAEQRTMTGTMLEDIRDRVEGVELRPGPPEISPLFYNQDGQFISQKMLGQGPAGERYFKVDLNLVRPAGQQLPVDADELMAVLVEIRWPVDPDSGEPIGRRPNLMNQTFFVSTLTGPDWTEIDNQFHPKVEF